MDAYRQSRLQAARAALAQQIREEGGVAARHTEAAREMMASIDLNNDGHVTWEEWADASLLPQSELDTYRQLFTLLDADDSGTLTLDELAALALLKQGSPIWCGRCDVAVLDRQLLGCRRCWREGLLEGMADSRKAAACCLPCADRAGLSGCGSGGGGGAGCSSGRCHLCSGKMEVVDNTWWLPLRDWPAMRETLTDKEFRKARIMDARAALMDLGEQLTEELREGAGVDLHAVRLQKKDFVKNALAEGSAISKKQASTLFKCFDLDGSGAIDGAELLAMAAAGRGHAYGCDGACKGALVFDDTLFACTACWREYQRGGFADPKRAAACCVSCVRRSAGSTARAGEAPACRHCTHSMALVPNEWWKKREDWSTMRELRAGEEEAVAAALEAASHAQPAPWEAQVAAKAQASKALRRQEKGEVWQKVGEAISSLGSNPVTRVILSALQRRAKGGGKRSLAATQAHGSGVKRMLVAR
ncbi:hypothetical protein HYH03_018227 [Edaphochlamys debaryana]|uniref:EF-hand domain-containing protein n=1 Tax=Edaphochlamys debaryana TaxID=47281 RepID=A0A835XMH6_9CHLO|nr:hypothetical protein HYH03_018227 [Edaphochlamys debaryana]|eukprot:KAG2482884.1 hypothetical protein HYH03_018227 [Edaphochlamys debaryana]